MRKKVKIVSKLALTFLLILGMLLVATGCGSSKEPSASKSPAPEPSKSQPSTSGEDDSKKPTFAIISDDEIGDRGFVDMAYEGVKKAAEEFGIEYKMLSTNANSSIYLDTIKSAAQNYDVIFLVPGYFYDVQLTEVMKQYPDKTYVYFDGVTDIDGCYSVTFAQNEGAFLAGVMAALLTQSDSSDMLNPDKIVGFVGGADMPVIHSYQVGFEQGVAYADPDVKVISRYAGDHYDPALGKVTAYNSFSEGADVIFQAAGPTGLGVLEAAKEYGFIAIGVDTDQGYIQPGYIASSMLKRVDTSVYEMIKKICEGTQLDKVTHFNVANGGISMADNEYYQQMVPEEIRNKVEEAAKAIASGDIKVEDYN